MNVITRQDAERFLDLQSGTADSLLDRLITDVSVMLARSTGRKGWAKAERTEYHDGGRSFILPDFFPIHEAQVWDDKNYSWPAATVVDADDYIIDAYGVIWSRITFSNSPQAIKLVYTAGYESINDIPEIIKSAALRQVEAEYNMRRRKGGQTDMQSGVVLPEVRQMLADYTRRVNFG